MDSLYLSHLLAYMLMEMLYVCGAVYTQFELIRIYLNGSTKVQMLGHPHEVSLLLGLLMVWTIPFFLSGALEIDIPCSLFVFGPALALSSILYICLYRMLAFLRRLATVELTRHGMIAISIREFDMATKTVMGLANKVQGFLRGNRIHIIPGGTFVVVLCLLWVDMANIRWMQGKGCGGPSVTTYGAFLWLTFVVIILPVYKRLKPYDPYRIMFKLKVQAGASVVAFIMFVIVFETVKGECHRAIFILEATTFLKIAFWLTESVLPLALTKRNKVLLQSSTSNKIDKPHNLADTLANLKVLNLFEDHLIREWNVENFHFYRSALLFRIDVRSARKKLVNERSSGTRKPSASTQNPHLPMLVVPPPEIDSIVEKFKDKARSIYKAYLDTASASQINISSKTLRPIKEYLYKTQTPRPRNTRVIDNRMFRVFNWFGSPKKKDSCVHSPEYGSSQMGGPTMSGDRFGMFMSKEVDKSGTCSTVKTARLMNNSNFNVLANGHTNYPPPSAKAYFDPNKRRASAPLVDLSASSQTRPRRMTLQSVKESTDINTKTVSNNSETKLVSKQESSSDFGNNFDGSQKRLTKVSVPDVQLSIHEIEPQKPKKDLMHEGSDRCVHRRMASEKTYNLSVHDFDSQSQIGRSRCTSDAKSLPRSPNTARSFLPLPPLPPMGLTSTENTSGEIRSPFSMSSGVLDENSETRGGQSGGPQAKRRPLRTEHTNRRFCEAVAKSMIAQLADALDAKPGALGSKLREGKDRRKRRTSSGIFRFGAGALGSISIKGNQKKTAKDIVLQDVEHQLRKLERVFDDARKEVFMLLSSDVHVRFLARPDIQKAIIQGA
ncbi:hypothetical protein AAMO2058_000298200 [Amorphochlora amoebiformis]